MRKFAFNSLVQFFHFLICSSWYSSMEQFNCSSMVPDVSVIDIGIDIFNFLEIDDDQSKNDNHIISNLGKKEEDENEEEQDDLIVAILAQRGYAKSDPPNPCLESSPSTPKLVSAMRDSREKQASTPKNLNVTWAPDVYDPPPTTATKTTLAKTSTERRRRETKNNGKKQQKWGGKPGKDKKQGQRYGGSSKMWFESLMMMKGWLIATSLVLILMTSPFEVFVNHFSSRSR